VQLQFFTDDFFIRTEDDSGRRRLELDTTSAAQPTEGGTEPIRVDQAARGVDEINPTPNMGCGARRTPSANLEACTEQARMTTSCRSLSKMSPVGEGPVEVSGTCFRY
jgi:hypothetical protein